MIRSCKDCAAEGIATNRPAPHPGPRCVSHHRAAKKLRSARAHELRIEATYRITVQQYWAIYESQGGRCAICQRASGARKRLAVDHDHQRCGTHDPKQGCPECVRALLCGPCNQMIGRYGVEALRRAIEVLTDPPARRVLDT